MLAIIGGSGLTQLSSLEVTRRQIVRTPYGEPSGALIFGRIGASEVVFLARHGHDHRFPPHRVNYRANLWALRSLGVRQVLGPCAVGGLRPHLGPGTVVVPDQVVDRTWGREHTYYDVVGGVVHVSFADPYCAAGRSAVAQALDSAEAAAIPRHLGGTLVVVNGPRFSSRAESLWHQSQGWDIVGMTAMPEAGLARELGLDYACLAIVANWAAGAGPDPDEVITLQDVLANVAAAMDGAARILRAMLGG